MQYTDSDAYVVHAGTGHRMGQDSAPVPTVWSAKDANMLIWSLMRVLEAAGVAGVSFDPDVPGSYDRLLVAVRATGLPVGSTLFGYYPTAPAGYVMGDGLLQPRASIPDLTAHATTHGLILSEVAWAAPGGHTFFGAGDGVTTIRMPDLRGETPRGWDNGRGVDVGRALGSWQQDAMQNAIGTIDLVTGGANGSGAFAADGGPTNNIVSGVGGTNPGITFDLSRVARTATETRSRNVALNWVIKT